MESESQPITERQVLRAAQVILDQLQRLQAQRYTELLGNLDHIETTLAQLRSTRRQLGYAMVRYWVAAASTLASRLPTLIQDVPYFVNQLQMATEHLGKQALPTLREVLAELEQVKQEFGDLQYSPQGKCLSITTEAVELEGRYLGEFEIRLNLLHLGDARRRDAYRVIALDPHPASSNDAVTHPHVSDEHLCEGDASAAIGSALAAGRIFDFFTLVKSVLMTYNSSSPYVALDDWDGVSCHECGYSTNPDDTHFCSSCENDFCDDCSTYCRRCDETSCGNCLEECEVCHDRVCGACRTHCTECGRLICKTCLEERRCPCLQEQEEQDAPDNDTTQDAVATRAGREDDGEAVACPAGGGSEELVAHGQAVPAQAAEDRSAADDPAILAVCVGEAPVPSRPRRNRGRRVRGHARR